MRAVHADVAHPWSLKELAEISHMSRSAFAQTFKSQFSQQYTVKAYNQVKSSTGTVEISKPGKMNWVYNNPQGNRVVSLGEKPFFDPKSVSRRQALGQL